jgi:hypothetical protein
LRKFSKRKFIKRQPKESPESKEGYQEFSWIERESTGDCKSRKPQLLRVTAAGVASGNLCYASGVAACNHMSSFGNHIIMLACIQLTVKQNP